MTTALVRHLFESSAFAILASVLNRRWRKHGAAARHAISFMTAVNFAVPAVLFLICRIIAVFPSSCLPVILSAQWSKLCQPVIPSLQVALRMLNLLNCWPSFAERVNVGRGFHSFCITRLVGHCARFEKPLLTDKQHRAANHVLSSGRRRPRWIPRYPACDAHNYNSGGAIDAAVAS